MERGIYSASSGGLLESRRLDLIANNLANVNTVGFKASRLVARQQEFGDTLASSVKEQFARAPLDHGNTPGVVDIEVRTDFSAGPVEHTGNPLNAALVDSKHFFMVQTPEGERLTRAGNFTINGEGQLSTVDGYPVMGDGGPIPILSADARITKSGAVMVDAQLVGRVRVVKVEDFSKLEKEAGTRFKMQGEAESITPDLIPESVELPNVSVVEAMVEMIATQRAFESYAKTVQTISELNDTNMRTIK
ncbi:MAG TPA: flagellar hook-basal body protein [Oligoflexia bacterium]|nr:flagellar hook-basal body protein [Oligoflexia bacterium]HMP49788.1 flagellar hook-basal body protein [Oligoflexia bacterium]